MNDERSLDESANPYASPQAPFEYQPIAGPRSGPRWEQPGPFWRRLFGTIKDCMGRDCVPFFRQMRREGGWFAPLSFCVIATFMFGVGAISWEVWPGETDWNTALVSAATFVIAAPVMTMIQLAVLSILHHGALVLLGGTRYPLETTFRVVAYASGCATPFLLIPGNLGSLVNMVVTLIFVGVGLCQAHEVSKTKAAAATLLPFVLCVVSAVAAIRQMEIRGVLDWLSGLPL